MYPSLNITDEKKTVRSNPDLQGANYVQQTIPSENAKNMNTQSAVSERNVSLWS